MKLTTLQQAKSKLLLQQAFFATLIMSTQIIESEEVPTAGTDMVKILYNPTWMGNLTVPQCMTVLAHEVLHIVFKHGLRKHEKNHMLWNISCDYAINLILAEAGFEALNGWCYDEKYKGMSAEEIYELLKKECEQNGGNGKGQPGQDPFAGDVMDVGNMSADEKAKLEQGIQQKVAQAANMARMAGKLPGALERLVNEVLNPTVPWQDLLRDYMTRITHDDESWMRRNRRFRQTYLPSRWSVGMGEIVFGVDTSGSIGQREIDMVLAEIRSVAESVRPETIRVVYCDAKVAGEETFDPYDDIKLSPKGGGGTDMREVIEHVEQYEPVVHVLLTDGYTPWPAVPPSYPLIVVCTTDIDVPVGDVVRVRV